MGSGGWGWGAVERFQALKGMERGYGEWAMARAGGLRWPWVGELEGGSEEELGYLGWYVARSSKAYICDGMELTQRRWFKQAKSVYPFGSLLFNR